MTSSRRWCPIGIAVVFGIVLVGCGGGSKTAPPVLHEPSPTPVPSPSPTPTATPTPGQGITVSITPSSAQMTIGDTQQFSAEVTNATNTAVTWAVNGVQGGDPSVGTISALGLYTAPGAVPAHDIAVTATSVADPTQSSSATITVSGFAGMLQYHNDPGITGRNLTETTLTPSNVNASSFGKLFSYSLDGQSFAQPLYASGVSIGGKGKRNVVFVVTEHDTVYAFDADIHDTLWSVSFINPSAGITTVPAGDLAQSVGGSPITPEIGITSTPVMDGRTGTLYVVAETKENGAYIHRLHALDVHDGSEKFGGPIRIQATVSTNSGQLAFDSLYQLQRPALLLSGGTIYICFGSFSDWGPYHGWVLAYDADTLQQVTAWNTSPNGQAGAIWQAGASLSVDGSGEIYGIVANGSFNPATKGYGDSVVKLDPQTLNVDGYFTPFNQQALMDGDVDIGSAGVTLLPDQPGTFPHLAITAGKEGRIYLLNRDDLGKFQSGSDAQIVQSLPNALGNPSATNSRNFSTATYWNGNVYFVANHDVVKQYRMANGRLSDTPVSVGTYTYPYPGANTSISANGNDGGILWAIEAGGVNVLHAYDATDVSHELYNSGQSGSRDTFGGAVRFTVPTVIHGKVYVAGQTQLAVFGPR